MLARVAHSIYWFGRYVERAENMARLVGVNANLLFDMPRRVEFGWSPLISITGGDELFRVWYDQADEASVVRFLLVDENNPGSILSSLAKARENLRTSRDIFHREAWEGLNDLHLYVRDQGDRPAQRRYRQAFLDRVIRSTQHLSGLLGSTMSRDDAFNFLRIGFNLERAEMTSRIIDIRSESLLPHQSDELAPFQTIQWMSVLKSLSGYQMYRRKVRLRVSGPEVLRFLLQDKEFPRAVHFCLDKLESCLRRLPRHEHCLAAIEKLQAVVVVAEVDRLVEAGLSEFLDSLQLRLNRLDGQIHATYFIHE
jgi:uncharacterized alpha-E superfamily protein